MFNTPERTGNRGYTLIEIMAVVFLMGIMLMIAAPHVGRSFQSVQVKTSAKKFAASLRAARSYAVAQRGLITLEAELGGASYQYSARFPNSRSPASSGENSGNENFATPVTAMYTPEFLKEPLTLGKGVQFLQFLLSDGVDIGGDRGIVRFFPKGNSTGGSFVIGSDSGATYRVDVDRVTGRVFLGAVE